MTDNSTVKHVSFSTDSSTLQTTLNNSILPGSTTLNSTTHHLYFTTSASQAWTKPITDIANITSSPVKSNESQCLQILYEDFSDSHVRIWDVMFLVPNSIFLVFMLYRLRRVWHRILSGIGSGGSPIFVTYFTLVAIAAALSLSRCVVSMTVDVVSETGSDANKILWIILRFFLVMSELSVLIFGVAFGHLDSRTSVRRVLFVTMLLAFLYSTVQCVQEFKYPDVRFDTNEDKWTVYSHGGTEFSFITSLLFLAMYVLVAFLPFIKWLQRYLLVPTRKSFYAYVAIMTSVYFVSALGSGLFFYNKSVGLCMLDASSYCYFAAFAPLVYWTFLRSYLDQAQPGGILFSYNTQLDEDLVDVADYDMRDADAFTVDSALGGVLEFQPDHDKSSASNVLISQPLHEFGNPAHRAPPSANADTPAAPSTESTHGFFGSVRA